MNKQQLIDKAIDELGGIWPIPFAKNEPYTVLYYINGNKESELATRVTSDGVEVQTKICTKKEFEARKAERSQHWYDYENQKALRLPPVGDVVLVSVNGLDCKAKVLEVTKNDCENLIACRVISGLDSRVGELKYFNAARPLDWDKRKADAVNELTDILMRNNVFAFSAADCAKAILAAGYRKCDN